MMILHFANVATFPLQFVIKVKLNYFLKAIYLGRLYIIRVTCAILCRAMATGYTVQYRQ